MNNKTRLVIHTGIIYILLHMLSILFKSYFRYFNKSVELQIGHEIRQRLYGHLLTLSMDFYEKKSSSELMVGIIEDSQITVEGLLKPVVFIADSVVKFIFGFYYMYHIDYQITLMMIPAGFIIYFFAQKTSKIIKKYTLVERHSKTTLWKKFDQGLKGIREVQICQQQDNFYKDLDKKGKRLNRDILNLNRYEIITNGLNNFFFMAVIGFIMTLGGYRVSIGHLSIGGLTALMMYNHLLVDPIIDFFSFYQDLQRVLVSAEKIFCILNEKPKIQDASDIIELPKFENNITFKNVFFNYTSRKNILKNINLTINKGDVIVFVGESGSGKSTLCKLIARFYEPTNGEITIDGKSLSKIKLEDWRKIIGMVFQEPFLFNGSLKDNLLFGNPTADDDEVQKVIKISGLKKFIDKLPNGLDTVLGDNGLQISGGERQRIAIGRVLLRNPDILILDESTSSLDSVTTKQIMENIKNEYKEKTIIIIAHKLTTINDFEKIYVLDKGEIVSWGTHQELLKTSLVYKKLYYSQFAKSKEDKLVKKSCLVE